MNLNTDNKQQDMDDTSSAYSSGITLHSDDKLQDYLLQGVSRTFALTIPQLPGPLKKAVSNAYLLCRIIDTIEDETALSFEQKKYFSEMFVSVIETDNTSIKNTSISAEEFSKQLGPLLSDTTIAKEHELVKLTHDVIRITHSLNPVQQQALSDCVRTMAQGMVEFQLANTESGLKDMHQMDRYCYYVAGVVGEMLTKLFCDYSDEIAEHRDEMLALSISFGQGLQMTNILKDIWDDKLRGACWLPQAVFKQHNYDLNQLTSLGNNQQFQQALAELIKTAHDHLENALTYTLLIPKHEPGIRKFCLWALGMAILTLRKVNNNRDFTSGQQVKISRRSVKATVITSNILVRRDTALKSLFAITSSGMTSD